MLVRSLLFGGYAEIPWTPRGGNCRSFALSLPKNLQKRTLERTGSHKMWPKGFSFLFSPVEFCSGCDKNCSTSIIFWVYVSWKIYLAYGNKPSLSFSGKMFLSFPPDLVSWYKCRGVPVHMKVYNKRWQQEWSAESSSDGCR